MQKNERSGCGMEQGVSVTRAQAYRVQLILYVLFAAIVTGMVFVIQDSPWTVGYWAGLLIALAFFPQGRLKKIVVPTVKNWWGLDRASTLTLLKLVCVSTVAFCVVVHGFLFANEFFSHDSLTYVAYDTSAVFPVWVETGRMLVPIYELIKGPAAAPWLIGVLFLFWMVFANLLLARFFRLKSKTAIVLTCGLLCANSSITLFGATYITWLDNNAFAILAAVAAAYFFCRCEHAAPLGVLCCGISLAIYQAYFTITVALCFFAALQALLVGEKAGAVIMKGLKYIVFLCGGFVVYYATWHEACSALSLTASRADESILSYGLAGVAEAVKSANLIFFSFLLDTDGLFGGFRVAVNLCLVLIFAVWLLGWILEDGRDIGSRLLLVTLVCLFPTVLDAIYVLIPGGFNHWTLTVVAREFFYFFLLVILLEIGEPEPRTGRRLRAVVAGLICVIIFQNGVFANQAYIKKNLEKSATLSVVTRILDRIETTEGYVPGQTQVVFAGELLFSPNLPSTREMFQTHSLADGLWASYAATYNIEHYIYSYLGYPLSMDWALDVSGWEVVQNMPAFPERDSVQFVEGLLVVKLS